MATRFVVPGDIPEQTSWRYSTTLVDDRNQPIPIVAIDTLTLTIYADSPTRPIINAVDNVSIKNVGRGTLSSFSGLLEIKFLPGDTEILDDTLATENHIALLSCTYNGGADAFNHEIFHKVKNLGRVT